MIYSVTTARFMDIFEATYLKDGSDREKLNYVANNNCFFFLLEDEELVSSFITSRSEKHLVHQIKRSLMATKNYTDITVNSVRKVK